MIYARPDLYCNCVFLLQVAFIAKCVCDQESRTAQELLLFHFVLENKTFGLGSRIPDVEFCGLPSHNFLSD